MAFAEILNRLQREKGESNYRFAKEIGVHQTSVANWKNGLCFPHPKQLLKIADHFGCTVDELLKEDV